MVTLQSVEQQLKRIGCNFRFWGRPEIRELTNILVPGELIAACVNGRYEGGFALLCVTNHRLLLIDRKPLFLTLEDVRFDMISEIDLNIRALDSAAIIMTPNRRLIFRSWNQTRLRKLVGYTQEQVMAIRQHFVAQQLRAAQASQQETASAVGGLILQGDSQQTTATTPYTPWLNTNPYTKNGFMLRRRGHSRRY